MITKEQCRKLNIGDYLLFFNTWRRIQGISQHPRGNIIYFKFIKIKGVGMTLYTNQEQIDMAIELVNQDIFMF